MKIAVDISFYPLNEEFVTPIKDFIRRIKEYEKVEIWEDENMKCRMGVAPPFKRYPKGIQKTSKI